MDVLKLCLFLWTLASATLFSNSEDYRHTSGGYPYDPNRGTYGYGQNNPYPRGQYNPQDPYDTNCKLFSSRLHRRLIQAD